MKEKFLLEGVLGTKYNELWWRGPRDTSELWSQSNLDVVIDQAKSGSTQFIEPKECQRQQPVLENH